MGTSPEGCDLHETSTGSPRRLSASSFRLCRHRVPTRPSLISLHLRDSTPLTRWSRCSGVRTCVGTEGRSGALPGGVLEDPSGTPQKGGSGTPQKGGCRDTKQCKFWRVSSVLIQGMFCFWGVRGVLGGPGGGRFWGHFWGLSALENGPTNHPSRGLPLHPSVRNQNQDGDGCADVPAVR